MTATRANVLRGIADYIEREMIPTITDIPIKIAVGALNYRLRNIPDSFNPLFEKPAVRMLLAESADGLIDVDATLNGVIGSLQSYGNLVLTIPPIPLISKQEYTLTFTSQDVDKLKQYIGGAI